MKTAVAFNLAQNKAFKLDRQDQCFVYNYHDEPIPQIFTIFEFIRLDATGSLTQLFLGIDPDAKLQKFKCFANTQEDAVTLVSNLTGVQLDPLQDVSVNINNFEIYHLS